MGLVLFCCFGVGFFLFGFFWLFLLIHLELQFPHWFKLMHDISEQEGLAFSEGVSHNA